MSLELSEQQKEQEREKAKQYAEMMNIPYVDPYPAPAPTNEPSVNPLENVSNEELIDVINKRTGALLSNLDDLKPKPTPEQLAQQAKEREDKMLAYGLTSAKFTKEEYDNYQSVMANKIGFIRSEITQQIKTANPELSDEAVNEKVSQYLFEHLDPSDSLRVAREKELLEIAENKINTKFKNIVNLPSDYGMYEEGMNNKATFDQKVQATLPVYKADVTRALESLRTFTVQIPDTKNPQNSVDIQLGYDDQDLAEMAEVLLSNDQVIKAVKEGYTPEMLKEVASYALWKKHGPRLISQAAKKYNSTQKENYQAGRKGLNELDSVVVVDDNLGNSLEDVYKQMINSSEAASKN
jgi:hypothetical protein